MSEERVWGKEWPSVREYFIRGQEESRPIGPVAPGPTLEAFDENQEWDSAW